MSGKIGEMHKGVLFLSELKSRLFREGFTLAIPEPDLGDDLWVADLQTSCEQLKFYRCQIKSAHSKGKCGDADKYTVNLTRSSSERIGREFYFLIGIFDDSLTSSKFHFACLPSKFLQKMNEGRYLRKNAKGRIVLDFFVRKRDGSPTYTLRAKYDPKPGKKNAGQE